MPGKFRALHLGLFERNHVSDFLQYNHRLVFQLFEQKKGARGPCFLHGPIICSVLKIVDYYEQYFEQSYFRISCHVFYQEIRKVYGSTKKADKMKEKRAPFIL